MLKTSILNPQLNELLSRFRHTNTIVIADRGFPYWPTVQTVDISLVDDVPKVLEVLQAIRAACVVGKAWMAQEFLDNNDPSHIGNYQQAFNGVLLTHEPHDHFKRRVPDAIGLIRTGETIQYANMILESA
ncbi:MAG: RbsD/FucU family protein [Planctomycetota bacterium]